MIRRRGVIALLATAAWLLPATAGAVRNPIPGTIVTVEASGRVASLDPTQAISTAERLLVANLFDRLTARGADGAILPSIADRWSASADSLTWTFDLLPGLVFADGRPLDAAAVVGAWNRIGADSPAAHRIPGLTGRVDGERLVVELDRPIPDLPARLSDPLYGVAAPVAGPDGGSLSGSGPFRLVRSDEAGVFVLAPRLSHPRGRPMPGRVVVRTRPDGKGGAISGLDAVLGYVRDPSAGTVDFSLAWTPGPAAPAPGRTGRSSR